MGIIITSRSWAAVWCGGLATVAVLVGCGAEESTEDNANPTVAGVSYEYELPDGWVDAGEPGIGASQALRDAAELTDSLITPDPEADFASQVTVVTGPAPAGTTLQSFADASVRAIEDPATFPAGVSFGSPPTDPKSTKLGGEPAMQFEHNGNVRTGSVSGEYRQRQIAVLRDGAAYVVTFSSVAPDPEAWEADQEAFQRIADSWQWTA